MIDKKLLEVLLTPPDAALSIVTSGPDGPHVINSWNSYVQISEENRLLIPAGRMIETEKNINCNNNILLTISNREVEGKTYKGTGFLIRGTADFIKEGRDFDIVKTKFSWARAALVITIKTAEQTL